MAKGNDIQSVRVDLLTEDDSGSNFSVVTPYDGRILIENTELLFHGDYERVGSGLQISHQGESLLVIDYFGTATTASLEAPNGATLTGKVVSALAGDPTAGQYAQVGGAGAPVEIGKVVKITGTATSKSTNGETAELKVGSPVYQGDVVQTEAESNLGISFIDETVFSMSADARMILDELIYDPANSEDSSMAFSLVQGAFVFVTGEIAPTGNMNVKTPVATMGIRGTNIKWAIDTDSGTEVGSLLPDPGTGIIGKFDIYSNSTGELLGTVTNLVDKYIVTATSGTMVVIAKSEFDKIEDAEALDIITEIWNIAQRDFAQIDGASSFGTIGGVYAVETTADTAIQGPASDGGAGGPPVGGGIVGDAPPVAIDDEFATNAQDSIPELLFDGTLIGANGNDYDNEGLVVVTQVNDTALLFNDGTNTHGAYDEVFLPSGAKIHVNADGHVEYFPNLAYNFLGRGDVDINTFSYVISDDAGQLDDGSVFVTITGRNQTAVLTNGGSAELESAYVEPDGTSDATLRLAGQGVVRFTDVDASDTHAESYAPATLTWTPLDGAGTNIPPLPVIGEMVLSYSPQTPDDTPVLEFDALGNLLSVPDEIVGAIGWEWSATDAELDFLGEGDLLTVVYPITATDNSGAVGGVDFDESPALTTNVTITIMGSNDLPVIETLSPAVNDLEEELDDDPDTNDPQLQDLEATGSLDVTEVDIADVLTGTTTGYATAKWNGVDVDTVGGDRDQRFDDLIDQLALTFDATATSDGDAGAGNVTTLNYTYDVDDADLNFLGQNDVVILTFPIQVTDNEGGFDTSTVTVTIRDTNDVPVIDTVAPEVTSLTEAVDADPDTNAGQLQTLDTSGSLSVTDVDVNDVLTWQTTGNATATWNGDDASADTRFAALIAEINLTFAGSKTVDGTQTTLDFDFDLANADLNFLGEGDQVVLLFPVQVADNEGGVDTVDIKVLITGTNDVPVITATDQLSVMAFTEAAETAGSDLTNVPVLQALNASGFLKVVDVDVGDTLTGTTTGPATVKWAGVDIDTAAGSPTRDDRFDDLIDVTNLTLDANVLNANADSTGTETVINYTYDVAATDFDFLGAGDEVIITYPVQVTDDTGAFDTTFVQVKITGTNDVPVITATDQLSVMAFTEAAETAGSDLTNVPVLQALNASGFLKVVDVDVGDTLTGTTTGPATVKWAGVDIDTAAGSPTRDDRFDDLIDVTNLTLDANVLNANADSTGTETVINYTYDVAATDFDFLGAGDEVIITYPVQVTDDTGAFDTTFVQVKITGTNDVPVISTVAPVVAAVAGTSLTEAADSDTTSNTPVQLQTLQATGSLEVVDVDVGDLLSGSHSAQASTATWNNGTSTVDATGNVNVTALIAKGNLTFDTNVLNANVLSDGTSTTIDYFYDVTDADLNFLGEGDILTITYPIEISDNEGGVDTVDVTVVITGTNDVAVITLSASEDTSVIEDGPAATSDPNAGGQFTVIDADVGESEFTDAVVLNRVTAAEAAMDAAVAGALEAIYGDFTFDSSTGAWDYTLDNDDADTQALNDGDTRTETLTVQSLEGTEKTITVTVKFSNDAPTIVLPSELTVPVNPNTPEDTPVAITGLSVGDVDNATLTVTLTASSTIDLSQTTDLTGLSGDGTDTVTFTGSVAAINAALNGLTYTPSPDVNDVNGTGQIVVEVTDNNPTNPQTVSKTVDISIAPVNDAPEIAIQTTNLITNGDFEADTIADGVSATSGITGWTTTTESGVFNGNENHHPQYADDIVDNQVGFANYTNTLSQSVDVYQPNAVYEVSFDVFTRSDVTNSSVIDVQLFVGTQSVLVQTITGPAKGLAETFTMTFDLSTAVFSPPPVPGVTDVKIYFGHGIGSNGQLNIDNVSVISLLTTNEDTALALNGIQVSDVDADETAGGEVEVELAVSNGTISVGTSTDLTVVGDGSGTVTLTGTLADINAALAIDGNVTYMGALDFNGEDSLSITIDDKGNSGSGGAKQAMETIAIYVAPVNDAPVITIPAPAASTQNLVVTEDVWGSGNQQLYESSVLSDDLINAGQPTVESVVVSDYTPAGYPGAQSPEGPDFILTDGLIGGDTSGADYSGSAHDGGPFTVTYSLNLSANPYGYDLTQITSYASHLDNRVDQKLEILVDYVSDGLGNFVSLGTYEGSILNSQPGDNATRLTLANDTNSGVDPFATGVGAIQFNLMNPTFNNTVWRELDVEGTATVGPKEDTTFILSGVEFTDVDANASDELTVTLQVNNGATVDLTSPGVLTIDDTGGDSKMIVSGTLAALNAAFANSIAVTPADDFNGTVELTLTANDNGNNGADPNPGPPGDDTSEETTITYDIDFALINDAPVAMADTASVGAAYFAGTGHYYQYIETMTTGSGLTWTEGQAEANAAGGYLATITSLEEHQFVLDKLNFGTDRVAYLGGSDAASEGNWNWIEGLNAQEVQFGPYAPWTAAEPNNNAASGVNAPYGGEDYLFFYVNNGFGGATFNDLTGQGNEDYGFIREYDSSPIKPIEIDLLANDTDVDGGAILSIQSVDALSVRGAAIFDNGDGTVTYVAGSAMAGLAAGEQVEDTFTYTIQDEHGATDTATVAVTLTGTGLEPPVVHITPIDDGSAGLVIDLDTNITLANSQIETNEEGGDADQSGNPDVVNGIAGDLISFTPTGNFDFTGPGAGGANIVFTSGGTYGTANINDGDITGSDGTYGIVEPSSNAVVLTFDGGATTVGSIAIYNGYTNRDDGTYILKDAAGTVLGEWSISDTSGGTNTGAHSFWLTFDEPVTTTELVIEFVNPTADATASFREIQVFGVPGDGEYVQGDGSVVINPSFAITDMDSTHLEGATIAILDKEAGDKVGFFNTAEISGSYDDSTGILSLTGTATIEQYEAALRSVTGSNNGPAPVTGDRTITFSVNDGSADSTPVSLLVNMVPSTLVQAVADAGGTTSSASATNGVNTILSGIDAVVDTLTGADGNDLIYGYSGNDILTGNDGNDLIFDGEGLDIMDGGAGLDTFVLADDVDIDQILNFDTDEDVIDLSEFASGSTIDAVRLAPESSTVNLTVDGTTVAQLVNVGGTDLSVDVLYDSSQLSVAIAIPSA